ncbi:hypothetical protein ECG_08570 [Echinococcus granulosus]|nr:hypothetical protein ECG_08570 [Echinococcus granulosus]
MPDKPQSGWPNERASKLGCDAALTGLHRILRQNTCSFSDNFSYSDPIIFMDYSVDALEPTNRPVSRKQTKELLLCFTVSDRYTAANCHICANFAEFSINGLRDIVYFDDSHPGMQW